jgi:hypothetical protein
LPCFVFRKALLTLNKKGLFRAQCCHHWESNVSTARNVTQRPIRQAKTGPPHRSGLRLKGAAHPPTRLSGIAAPKLPPPTHPRFLCGFNFHPVRSILPSPHRLLAAPCRRCLVLRHAVLDRRAPASRPAAPLPSDVRHYPDVADAARRVVASRGAVSLVGVGLSPKLLVGGGLSAPRLAAPRLPFAIHLLLHLACDAPPSNTSVAPHSVYV